MFDKLDFITEKYDELSKKVSDPDVINNQPVWQKYIKEMGEIEPIVKKYNEYKKAKTDLAEAPSYLFSKVLTPELWSSVFSVCIGISSLVGAAILSARPQEEKSGFKTAIRLCMLAGVVILAAVSYWVFVDRGVSMNAFLIAFSIGCLLTGFLVSFVNIPINTAVMRIVDRDKLSKVSSIISIGSQGMTPIASVLAGAILGTLGSTALLVACALGFTATAALTLFNRSIRDL